MTPSAPHTWSIRRRVLAWLLAGMVLVFTANLVSSYYGNRDAVDSAHDRLLLASASAIAERTAVDGSTLKVDLPYAALDMLASTAQDRVFYAVLAPDGTVVTGYSDIPQPTNTGRGKTNREPWFYNAFYKGASVRIVEFHSYISSSKLSGYASIRVAQTRGEREALTLTLLRQSAVWTLLIAVSGAVAAWLGISIGLRPLDRLREALGRRSSEDVRPILHEVPTEFTPLVGSLNDMLQRIDYGFKAMRRFISDASHQLKTPLAGLQAQTEMALRETDVDAIRDSLAKVDISARRTSRLARQLLSHAQATEMKTNFNTVDLAQIARETVSMMDSQARTKQIDLGYEGDSKASVLGDHMLLGELAMNLTDNAIRYSPPRSLVTLAVKRTGTTVSFCVQDQGPGIPAESREDVFERFVRLPGMEIEGCGLGLTIVREIASRHDGHVTLGDAPSGGLRVRVDFPAVMDGED